MLGFEPFNVRAWMHEGMTEQVVSTHVTSTTTVRRKSRLAKFLIASAVGFGAAQLDLFPGTTWSAMEWRAPLSQAVASNVASLDLVSDGHWEKLLAKMNTWHSIEEPRTSLDIDPLA